MCWLRAYANWEFRFSQIHYWLRCSFPVWRHWTAKQTRKGVILQRIYKAIQLSVLASVLAGVFWLRKSPQYRSQILQALMAGKEWIWSKA